MSVNRGVNSRTGLEIAVIGMAGRFPGARNIGEFWENLKNGVESISFFSDEELRESGNAGDWLENPYYVKAKGLMEKAGCFDASFFGYTPREGELMDPQVRLFHECTWEAFEDAGYDPLSFKSLIGIYAGASPNLEWEGHIALSSTTNLSGRFLENQLSNKDYLCTQIAYKFNLRGPCMVVYTACSTSLAALHQACRALLQGECKIATAGGVRVSTLKKEGYLYQDGMVTSPDGHCRAFDINANGSVGGDGVGIMVLKRLKDAIMDRDNIYAVIKGSSINNDGNRKVGFTAPSIKGQLEVIRMAQQIARVEPESISYIETHGTGTPLGDQIEIDSLKAAFNTKKKGFCKIGSVKTNVGHLDTAAGVTSFIKAVLVIKHRQIPPSLNIETPNPKLDFENSPFSVNTELVAWRNEKYPLRAGVSSFGIGGTNVHVILEEAPESGHSPLVMGKDRNHQLIVLSAKTKPALDRMTENLVSFLKKNPGINLPDAAYTLQVGRRAFEYRKMLVCQRVEEAAAKLSAVDSTTLPTPVAKEGKCPVIFMFPGLGAQYVNMGLELYQTEQVFREEMDRCFKIVKPLMGYDIKEILYPGDPVIKMSELSERKNDYRYPAGGAPQEQGVPGSAIGSSSSAVSSNKIHQIDISQLLVFIFEYALAKLLISWGIKPYAMIGYSFGEYAAACLSGVFSLEEALKLTVFRGKLIRETPPGKMVSVPLSKNQSASLLTGDLDIAIDNGLSCIVSGADASIDTLVKQLKEKKIICMPLEASHAIHSRLMAPILVEFEEKVSKLTLNKPQIPYISNVTGNWIRAGDAVSPGCWAAHLRETVQFARGIKELSKIPGGIFLEVGPGRDLSAVILRFLPGENHPIPHVTHVINLVKPPRHPAPDIYYLLNKVGHLWLHGIPIDWKGFHPGEARFRISLPTYAFEGEYYGIKENSRLAEYDGNDQQQAQDEGDISNWLYIPSWNRSPLHPHRSSPISGTGTWLVFHDKCGIGSLFARQLRKKGLEVISVREGKTFTRVSDTLYEINASTIHDYTQLFGKLAELKKIPREIVHFWNVNETGNESGELSKERIDKAQALGFYSLIYISRAIGECRLNHPFQIFVISNNMQEVTGEELLYPEKATLLGAVRVIPQEYPLTACRSIDFSFSSPGSRYLQEEKIVNQLLVECMAESGDRVVAYRGNHRWTETVRPLPLEDPGKESLPLREQGVYLVTGGLGNIGYVLARYLARSEQARLILTGRSFFPAKEEWDRWLNTHGQDDRVTVNIKKVRELERLGSQVMVLCADAADKERMEQGILGAEKKWGSINGVFHAAGIIAGESFALTRSMDRNKAQLQFQAKVYGTLVLEEILKNRPLDFCCIISSISSVLGGLRFAAYSAANIFMDAFVNRHNQLYPGTWRSVNWDGMDAEKTVNAFQRILSLKGVNQVVFSRGGNLQKRIRQWVKFESSPQERGEKKARPDLLTPYIAPRNPTEQIIVDIWQKLFGYTRIGVSDDFLELGGDSLKAITAISGIHKALDVEIPLIEFFKNPTIEKIASYIISAEKITYTLIEPTEEKEYYKLSSAQKRLYFIQQMLPGSTGYNMPLVFNLEGELDKERLEGAIKKLIKRHEALRTSFRLIEEEPVQGIGDNVEFEIEYYDLQVTGAGDRCRWKHEGTRGLAPLPEEPAAALISSFIRPFDLAQAPLLRVELIKENKNKHILMVDMHHIISDGLSLAIFAREFMKLYEGDELPELKLQYKDYAQWQDNQRYEKTIREQEAYWLKEFQGEVPVLNLPFDYTRPETQDFKGSSLDFHLGIDETLKFKEVVKREEVTIFVMMLSIFTIFLSKLCNQKDIVIGTPVMGRTHSELEGIFGIFVNTLALRNHLPAGKSSREFLKDVKEKSMTAFENQEYPFEELVQKIVIERDISKNPLFNTVLVLQNVEIPVVKMPGLKLTQYNHDSRISKFDLGLYVSEMAEKFFFSFEYSTALFKEETISRFIEYFKEAMAVVLENPKLPLRELEIIPREKKKQVFDWCDNTGVDFPGDKTIHQLFEEQLEKTPDHIALIGQIPNSNFQIPNKEESFGQFLNAFGEGWGPAHCTISITYKELNEKSNQLAHRLLKNSVMTDTIVAIMVERSIEMITGILGILKAGGAYLPIDPDYPGERIKYMLTDSGAKVMVTTGLLAEEGEKVRRWEGDKIFLKPDYCPGRGEVSSPTSPRDVVFASPFAPSTSTSTCQVSSTNLAYVIYTSGTTGKPKGVMIEHKNVVRLLFNREFPFDFDARDTWTMFHSPCFDFSVWEMYGALLYGGKLILIPKRIARDPGKFLEILESEGCTVLNQTPSAFYALLNQWEKSRDTHLKIRWIIFGGESLNPLKLKYWKISYPRTKLINMFGITEITVHLTYKEIRDAEIESGKNVIGRAMPTSSIYIMDHYLKLLPPGTAGELCAGGEGVARGYLNNPSLTRQKFLNNPYKPSEKLYCSGDLAKITVNDDMEMEYQYLGRIDHQVQIRGFRIEPAEIENRLLTHEHIREAVVIHGKDSGGDNYLCAYFVSGKKLEIMHLRDFLFQWLPDYMVPNYFVQVEKIPLTSNGKVDRKVLPEPAAVPGKKYAAPRDEIEKKLAAAWSEVLGQDALQASPGIDDDFFALGGHSLKAAHLISKLHKELDVKVPLIEMFKIPTIRELAAYIKKQAKKDKYVPIKAAEKKEYYVVSSAQKMLYIQQHMEKNSTSYNIPVTLAVEGVLNKGKLKQSFEKLIRRHESLRTSFALVSGNTVQRIHAQVKFEIEYYDLQVIGAGDRCRWKHEGTRGPAPLPKELATTLISSFIRPFDLSLAPLLRVGLISPGHENHLLMADMHHIITDGISMKILIEELAMLHEERELPALNIQYKDFTEWKYAQINSSNEIERQTRYWLNRFKEELPLLILPTDFPRGLAPNFQGGSVRFQWSKDEIQVIKKIADPLGVTTYMVLLALYNILLYKLTGQEDIIVGTDTAGRRHSDLGKVIGMFINILSLRNYPSGDKTFATFLQEVKTSTLEAFENQDYPFEELVEKISPPKVSSRSPLFDVMFTLNNIQPPSLGSLSSEAQYPGLKLRPYHFEKQAVKFDLVLIAAETENEITFDMEYKTSLFTQERIEKYTQYFKQILSIVAEDMDIKLKDINIAHKLLTARTVISESDFDF